jgi:hypothetical protein
MEITIQKNVEIKSVDDWFFCAPPKGKEKQWKDNYSAKELANFATSPVFKSFVKNLLLECNKTKCNKFICIPEAETELPGDYRGPRNHDLLMIAENLIIGIEAKVNEPYGNSLKQESRKCSKGKGDRIDWMKKVLFDSECNDQIKYQLMTGVCGTLLEAARRNVEKCIFLVLSFNIDGVEYNQQNEEAFDLFIEQLGMKGVSHKSFTIDTEETGKKIIKCYIKKKNITIPLRYKF